MSDIVNKCTPASSRSSHGRRMLGQAFYSAESHFQRDLQLLRTGWHCLGHVAEAPQLGDFLLRHLVDAEVIVTRSGAEAWSGMYNVCRHRALRLCTEPRGATKGVLRCPYHGWSYDLSGQLIAAPNMADAEGFDCRDYPLVPVAIEAWNGLLFGSVQPATPLGDLLNPLQPLIADWRIDSLGVAWTMEYEVAANWKLIVQNFSECYHCPLVHPQLNRLTPYRSAENQLAGGGPVLGGPMHLDPSAHTMSLDGGYAAPPLPGLDSLQKRRVYYYSIFPTTFLSPHPDYVLLHRLVPQQVNATRVSCQILTAGADPDPQRIEQAIGFWDQTNRQDWEMCERSQLGVESGGYRPGPYSNLESLLGEFDAYYLRQVERLP